MRPSAVVVDDGHACLNVLAALIAARHQLGQTFSIIVSTWPSKSDDLQRTIAHAEPITLAPLPRPDIDDIIQYLGITGHLARTVVLDQAEGRPGWAIILANLLIKGESDAVVSGSALVDSAIRFVHETATTEIEPDVLACIAAVGYVTAAPLETMATFIGIPLGQLTAVVHRLARNGLLEETRDGWQLLPALRAPLVAHRFFSQRPERQWSTIQKAFPRRDHDFARVALDVALSTGSSSARNAVESFIQTLPDPSEWSRETVHTICEYARLDESAAGYAVAQAKQLLNSPREPIPVHGVMLDPARDDAVTLLESAVRSWVTSESIAALLDLAHDTPYGHRHASQDPLYVLTDLANRIHPDIGTNLEVRRRLLTGTLRWLAGRRTEQSWVQSAEVLSAVFAVNGRAAWQDPGRPGQATLADRVEPADHLEELVRLWEQVARALRSANGLDGAPCPAEALVTLTDLAGSWLRLGEGLSPGGARVTDQQRLAGHRGGTAMIESLREAVQAAPAVALHANRMLNELRRRGRSDEPRPALFSVDTDLVDLVGQRDPYLDGDIDTVMQAQSTALRNLAVRIVGMGPQAGCARAVVLAKYSRHAVQHDPTILLADVMRPLLIDPPAWCQAAVAHQHAPLVTASLRRCLDDGLALPDETVMTVILGDDALRRAAITAVLPLPEITPLGAQILQSLHDSDDWILDQLIFNAASDASRHHLLSHSDDAVAGRAALAFDIGYGRGTNQGPFLPARWMPRWREAFLRLRCEYINNDFQRYRAAETLGYLAEQDPDMAEQWFTRRIEDSSADRYAQFEPRGSQRHLRLLPQTHRERLARRCGDSRWISRGWLTYLTAYDRELATRLLSDDAISTKNLIDALAGCQDEAVESLGPILLARGITPEDIAQVIASPRTGTFLVDHGAATHRHLIEFFAHLQERVPALESIAIAGKQQQQRLLAAAEAAEEEERRHGWR